MSVCAATLVWVLSVCPVTPHTSYVCPVTSHHIPHTSYGVLDECLSGDLEDEGQRQHGGYRVCVRRLERCHTRCNI